MASCYVHSSPSMQDTTGSVKLWEITRGAVIEDFGKVLICPQFLGCFSLGFIHIVRTKICSFVSHFLITAVLT